MIITSLAPAHKNKDSQLKAVESWKRLGKRIVSVNHKSEINDLEKDYDVEFVEPKKTGFDLFGKHYIPASELVRLVRENGEGLIINSDIIIKDLPAKRNNPVIFNRYDFNDTLEGAKFFESGFDAFYLKSEHCDIPETRLCLGQCHWDYWLPLMLINKGFKLERSRRAHIFHKRHELQYSYENWKKTATVFGYETGIRGSLQSISNKAFNLINSQITNI